MVKSGTSVSYVVSLGVEGKRFTGSINTTFQLVASEGPGNIYVDVMVRLKQDKNGDVIYKTLMDTTTLGSDQILSIDFPEIEGLSGVEYGEVEVINVENGLVMQSYPVEFSEIE